jgi:hypothetical protein
MKKTEVIQLKNMDDVLIESYKSNDTKSGYKVNRIKIYYTYFNQDIEHVFPVYLTLEDIINLNIKIQEINEEL